MITFVKLELAKDGIHKNIAYLKKDDKVYKVQFGAFGMSDYTLHKDKERKERYIARHIKREDWKNPLTSGFWSRWYLWNKPTKKDSLEDLKKRFHL